MPDAFWRAGFSISTVGFIFHCYCWFYLVSHQELVCDCSGMIMWYINTYIKVWLFSELFVPIFIKWMDLQKTAIALREAIIWSSPSSYDIEGMSWLMWKLGMLTPRNMFLEESNPAANILAVYGAFRSQTMRHANLEIVLWVIWVSSLFWLPEIVSVTTKSMGLSVDLPTWKN